MNTQPLVSVAVMTYNSSKYVLETLDSIKDQTYQNIELVISDDASTDDTIAICNKWLDKHRSRFTNVKVLVPPQNTGQSGNYNRAFRACTGEWIKEIDGDDLLLPNCLTDLMEYVGENPEAKYVFGKLKCIGGTKEAREACEQKFDHSLFKLTQKDQLDYLIYKRNFIASPCSFYNRNFVVDLGFEHDERIPFMEDYPKWINLLRMNVTFYSCPKYIVKYRLGSGVSTSNLQSPSYFNTYQLLCRYYLYPEWIKKGEDYAFERITNNSIFWYSRYYETNSILNKYANFLPIRVIIFFVNRLKIKI